MSPNPIFHEFAYVTYYFANFIVFGVVFSLFYSVNNHNIWSRVSKRNIGARHFMIVSIIFITGYLVTERLLSDKIIDSISELAFTTIPLLILSVSLLAFYIVKVIAGRRILFPDSIITMAISILAFIFTVVMITNGNKIPYLQS